MKKSPIFIKDNYKLAEEKIKKFLNGQQDFLSKRTASSTRATGDAIQELLEEGLEKMLEGFLVDYSAAFARRAMADIAFTDSSNFHHIVDVKTHRLETSFNMPNLTSVQRLARLYEDEINYFDLLLVAYSTEQLKVIVKKVHFVPIEFLAWKCLTVGALGWGQIQIANSNNVVVVPTNTRKEWMIELCETLFDFYPAEKEKIDGRLAYFRKVKQEWEKKKE